MRRIIAYLLYCLLQRIFDRNVSQVHEGIRICVEDDADPVKKEQDCEHIIRALELIKTGDPKRFRRVQKRLAYIVNGFCTGTGEYSHPLNACYVDLERFDFVSDEEWCVLQVACTLVHEATHGEIEAHKIQYSRSNFVRIERICHQEEMQFLTRVKPESEVVDFDQSWWEDYWEQSSWQRGAKLLQRFRRGSL